MPTIELLAPAKDKDTALAAINYGADAVYMGGPGFGARAAAGNSLADIEAVARHAHLYAAKVYLAVNTVLLDNELEAARSLINSAYNMGVDAVIVQDTGLLAGDLPPVAIHASTQMHNSTVDKVRFLAQTGVKRAVLPREFSLAEITAVHAAVPGIELESFIHGALCVSYSGQCYLSYAVGGRSANRGECAQPCRKQYTLLNEAGRAVAQDKYLLSLKDLCLADYLEDLMDAGVSSFKIEGRLKNINYVKNVVAYYRQRIDAILAGRPDYKQASAGKVYFDFTPDLAKTFNRRYTDYFINSRRNDIHQPETPKALGEELGRTLKSKAGLIKLDTAATLSPGDGLCWFENDALKGANVNKVTPDGIALQNVTGIKTGVTVFRNYDHKFVKALEASKTARKLRLDVTTFVDGGRLFLQVMDAGGLLVTMPIAENVEPARDEALAAAAFNKAFARLGDTPFELGTICHKNGVPFIPAGRLNALRREAAAQMATARQKAFKAKLTEFKAGNMEYPVKTLDFTANATNVAAREFYQGHGATVNELGAETGLDMSGRIVMTTKHCLRYSYGQCVRQCDGSLADWYLVDDKGHKYRLKFNCDACVMEIVF